MSVILFAIRFAQNPGNHGVKDVSIMTGEAGEVKLAWEALKHDARYALYAVIPKTRTVEGVDRFLVEHDRARGASSHLKGKRSKLWRGERVVSGVTEMRIA